MRAAREHEALVARAARAERGQAAAKAARRSEPGEPAASRRGAGEGEAERTAIEATRLRARRRRGGRGGDAAAPAAEATASESVAALHERLLEGEMLLDEEMATLRLEAAKAPEKAAAGGRKSLAERMAEKHGIALSSWGL